MDSVRELVREWLRDIQICMSLLEINEVLKRNEEESEIVRKLANMNIDEMIEKVEETYRKASMVGKKVYTFYDGHKKEISNEMVIRYSGSIFNCIFIDVDSRYKKEIEMDYSLKYLDEIVKYMNNQYEINELNGLELEEFCKELIEMRIPFQMDILSRLYNGSNEYGVGWKNMCVIVNGNEYNTVSKSINWTLQRLEYNNETGRIEGIIDGQYEPILQVFCKFIEANNEVNNLWERLDRRTVNRFINDGYVNMSNEDAHHFFFPIYSPFLKNTILIGQEYDNYLRNWFGDHCKWKLLYRASEHGYTSESFHECCDNKGPTLVIIKSSEGWIFGGYTTRSWEVSHSGEESQCILMFFFIIV